MVFDAFLQYGILREEELNNGFTSVLLSAIVQTSGNHFKTARLIALTTGTKHIDAAKLYEGAGRVIADTHGEIVARRCLVSYLYDQIERHENLGI